ncbi:hypothetical protein SDC9_198222 [bioreactor metagenome]|uniref:Uncharacterized protein n=1 Tax=bioreactor metagenome TaxID=1076179 RepID=A0A645IH16_9ZZZZ
MVRQLVHELLIFYIESVGQILLGDLPPFAAGPEELTQYGLSHLVVRDRSVCGRVHV